MCCGREADQKISLGELWVANRIPDCLQKKKKKKRSAPDWRVVTGLILNGLGPHLCERMSGPRPVVLSGPSGAGKSTLLKKLMKDHEGVFGFSVSRMFLGLSLISIHGKTCCTKENSTIN